MQIKGLVLRCLALSSNGDFKSFRATVEKYLLEKSRIVSQAACERFDPRRLIFLFTSVTHLLPFISGITMFSTI